MTDKNKAVIESMFAAGAHFGLGRSRRHPSVVPYIFSTKNDTDIFDLEKTASTLSKVTDLVTNMAKEGKVLMFVGGKKEASNSIKNAATSINMPYVEGRWIGGTITNFLQIRKRVDRFLKLSSDKENGELGKYTKRERMLIDKEIAKLDKMFSGIISLKKAPDALFVIDPRREKNAVKEATDAGIPVIALSGSDCDLESIKFPVVGNDSSKMSIQFFLDEVVKAYKSGASLRPSK